ncbi:MAG: hypothetical protein AABX54_03205 [Nanoarchaeota archaeon]
MTTKSKSKKVEEISLPMRYNPGLGKYEPELPARKTRKKTELKIDWKWLIIFIIIIFILSFWWLVFYSYI